MIINSLGEASDCHRMELKNADIVANKSPIQIGSLSNFVEHEDNKKDGNIIVTKMKKSVEIIAKPRTALFQGREDDEPMARQVIQFGSFLFDAKINKMKEGILANTTRFGTKFIFQGINLCKQEKKQEMVFHVGSIQVMVPI